MDEFTVRGPVERFPGENGWFYVKLSARQSAQLGPLVRSEWPALLKIRCTLGDTTWKATIMPIKDGPLFVALPAKVRKAEAIVVGQRVTLRCLL